MSAHTYKHENGFPLYSTRTDEDEDMILKDHVEFSKCGGLGRGQSQGQQLLMQTLAAELVELSLPSEVLTNNLLHLLTDGRLKNVPVDLHEPLHFR